MEHWLVIGKVNLKYNLYRYILVSAALLCIAPLLMGVKNLDQGQAAKALEMYMALLGIILLPPIFFPEQDLCIRELTNAKYCSNVKVHGIRLLESMIVLLLFIGIFIWMLRGGGSTFPTVKFFWGTVAGAVFLGGLGVLAHSLSNQIAIAYMIPVMYYVGNFSGDKYFGKCYLFSMMKNSYEEKIWLGIMGILCMGIGIGYRKWKKG